MGGPAIPGVSGASGPKALAIAGRAADGAFINFGLLRENCALRDGGRGVAQASGRNPGDVELWQIAALDCHLDAEVARNKIIAILGVMTAISYAPPISRSGTCPISCGNPRLRRRYSTRPGAADAALVSELGLFDYLADRFAIFGTPEDCRAQLLRAQKAGLERIVFTVSLASDPLATVELFGREVLPAFH